MKKMTYGFIILSVFMYLVVNQGINIDFIIKCTIIYMSLIIHQQGHNVMRIITKRLKHENVRGIIIGCGGFAANYVIFLIFRKTHFAYSGYITVINFSLVVINLLPIHPLDFHSVFKYALSILIKEDVVLKISSSASWLAIIFVFLIGILQMIFFSYNCSMIITGLLLKNYEKFNLNEKVAIE